jgi:hypothetical protein
MGDFEQYRLILAHGRIERGRAGDRQQARDLELGQVFAWLQQPGGCFAGAPALFAVKVSVRVLALAEKAGLPHCWVPPEVGY